LGGADFGTAADDHHQLSQGSRLHQTLLFTTFSAREGGYWGDRRRGPGHRPD